MIGNNVQCQSATCERPEIWIINQYAITPDLPGGTRHYDFGCELVKKGYQVRIFACDVNLALRCHTKLKGNEMWREEEVNGVRFVWVRSATYQRNDWRRVWNMLSFSLNVYRVGVALKERPRAIIGSSPHPFAAFAAWAISRQKHSEFILELRDLWPQALVDMGGMSERSIQAKLLRLLERFLYRSAARIIVLALGSRDYLIRRGVPPEKIAYIPNGVHLKNFAVTCVGESPAATTSRLRAKFGFDRFTIVYAGAHGPANALETVLRAADLLRARKDIEFVLVGDGPSKCALVQEASRLKLNNVRFMDPVPKEQIPDLLSASDVTLVTLRAVDTFSYAVSPNKLFDYMAAGKPVICAIPGDMARLVTENDAGIAVEPENPEALARAVERMLDMTDAERIAMGRRGRDLVEREFSREKLADKLFAALTMSRGG